MKARARGALAGARRNPGTVGAFVHEHPWMTLILGVVAISATARIILAIIPPKILPGPMVG